MKYFLALCVPSKNQLWDVAHIRGVSHLLGLPQYYEEEEEEEELRYFQILWKEGVKEKNVKSLCTWYETSRWTILGSTTPGSVEYSSKLCAMSSAWAVWLCMGMVIQSLCRSRGNICCSRASSLFLYRVFPTPDLLDLITRTLNLKFSNSYKF